jgi:soluble lytic murein transglycosylase-like protein
VIFGSLIVCLVGFYLTGQMVVPTRAEEIQETPHTPEVLYQIQTDPGLEVSPESSSSEENFECQISERFPEKIRQWCPLITSAASKHNLPPDLIAAVIWIESGGNPRAYSQSGAVGLMQVMPRDGLASQFQCINGPCFANRPSMEELQDPQFNINFGSKMLASLVKKHGNYRDALKAYGPMKVGYSYADKVLSIFKQYGK